MLAPRLFASCYRRQVSNLSLAPRNTSVSSWTRYNSSVAAGAVNPLHDSSALRQLDPTPEPIRLTHTTPEFSSLGDSISRGTLHALTVSPFKLTHMTQVQAEVLKLLPEIAEPRQAEGGLARDLLVKARTGTGKTLAFLIPAIEQRLKAITAHAKQAVVDAGLASDKHLESRAVKAFTKRNNGILILSPTRELAGQIGKEAMALTEAHGFFVHMFVGGESKARQIRNWKMQRRDITVATPGRLRDLLQTEPEVASAMARTQVFILDEADTLLDMGFREDIEKISEYLPKAPELQTFLFSATVPRSIQQLARTILSPDHQFIDCVDENAPLIHSSIEQYHTVLSNAGDQIPHILRLISHDQLLNPHTSKIVLFFPTTKMTQLYTTLINELSRTCTPSGKQTRVFDIHSKKSQEQRSRASEAFKSCTAPSILVTTDVSARGVDYPGVTRVIQVGIPSSTDQYVHRVGRTGRAGLTGRADLVLLDWETGFVSWMLTGQKLKPLTVNQLKEQVQQLSKEHDSDPDAFYANKPKAVIATNSGSKRTYGKPYVPKNFDGSVAPVMEDIVRNCADLIGQLDEAVVGETFASMCGYYAPKSEQLRVQKSAIVAGLRTWSTDAVGLSKPPYVSSSFLHKLGFSEPKSSGKTWGSRSRDFGRDAQPWAGRGGSRSYDDSAPPRREYSGRRSRDDNDEYRPRRFERR